MLFSFRTYPNQHSRSWSNLRTFALHALAFVLPVITLCFWVSGPHSPQDALLWIVPVLFLYCIDYVAPVDHEQPREDLPAAPYNLQLYALAALQLTNNISLLTQTSQLSIHSTEGLVQTLAMLLPTLLVAGVNTGYSGVVVAHELVHRRSAVARTLGRVLLGCVLYEHYATEHVRGHHPRVGTPADHVTARFGESLGQFMRRGVPGQWRSAWQLENTRIQADTLRWYSPRRLRHRVLQGVLGEVALLVSVAYVFGLISLLFFVAHAAVAITLLETVNYIEHWGLLRRDKKVRVVDSWDSDNWFTHYTLVGLSRHADHHTEVSRPYHRLRCHAQTPKMPHGYFSMVAKALLRNRVYQELATRELERLRLGPFMDEQGLGTSTSRLKAVRESLDTGRVTV